MAVVEVSTGPSTGAAYARAALGMVPGARRGATLPDVEMVRRGVVVDRSHLAAYDRVCGFRLSDSLPATYPHVLAFPLAMQLMTAADFPVPLIGLVHVSNRITVSRPLSAAEPLDLSVRAADLRDHPRGRQFDVVTTATVDGEEVWREVSTYLRITSARPTPSDSGTPSAGDTTSAGTSSTGDTTSAGTSSTGDTTSAGTSAAGASSADGEGAANGSGPSRSDSTGGAAGGAMWRVPARVGADYAAVSGDRNPIHTSRLGARLFGFPRPIAHGMWTKARALAALEGRLPDAYTVEVTFKAPLLLPAKPTFTTTHAPEGWTFTLASKRPHLHGAIT